MFPNTFSHDVPTPQQWEGEVCSQALSLRAARSTPAAFINVMFRFPLNTAKWTKLLEGKKGLCEEEKIYPPSSLSLSQC